MNWRARGLTDRMARPPANVVRVGPSDDNAARTFSGCMGYDLYLFPATRTTTCLRLDHVENHLAQHIRITPCHTLAMSSASSLHGDRT
jgi:hypothetical protein